MLFTRIALIFCDCHLSDHKVSYPPSQRSQNKLFLLSRLNARELKLKKGKLINTQKPLQFTSAHFIDSGKIKFASAFFQVSSKKKVTCT